MNRQLLILGTFLILLPVGLEVSVQAQEPRSISLPMPQTDGGKPLMRALKERKTTREFRKEKLSEQVLSNLLWAAFGINRPESGRRTAPSAMNWQEIDVYVIMEGGLYLYEAKGHLLKLVKAEDLRAQAGTQDFVHEAPVNLIYVADTLRMGQADLGEREIYAAADTGFIAENVYLFCASEGLATVVRASVDKPKLSKAMELRPEQRIVLAQSVGYPKAEVTGSRPSHPNDLTPSERAAGWKLLFDGKTSQGWRGFRRQDFPSNCWVIDEGCLHRIRSGEGRKSAVCGDIITVESFDNFELSFEWRVSAGANSGVKYLISEDRPQSWEQAYLEYHYADLLQEAKESGQSGDLTSEIFKYTPIGFEFQLIDDQDNEDARSSLTRVTGALYDLMAPRTRPARPAGQFNHGRIVIQGNHIEHWINDVKVLEFERDSQELKSSIAHSKFARMKGFGSVSRGHIDLQDHDGEVWFRNIKIRPLTAR